jgi:hypothetical protein
MEAITAQETHIHDYGDFDAFVRGISDRFASIEGPVFETDATGLYDAYLNSFTDPAARQYHTCSCCKQFIERFGTFATVNDDGHLVPIWNADDAPEHYKAGVEAMARLVRRASITMPFLSSLTMYGTPVSGRRSDGDSWTHFAIMPRPERVYAGTRLRTAYQAACEKREEFASVRQALGEYTSETCNTARRLLNDDLLGNSEAALGQANFLCDLHAARDSVQGSQAKDNLVYNAVAQAPSGFCHPRSSMIATLLDDIAAGKSFERAQAAWNAKMHPLRYQRPQAAPTAGNIAQAEKLFAQLGLAPALARRIARLDEIPKLWEPRQELPAQPEGGGVFGHLTPKGAAAAPAMTTPEIMITLEKFVRTVVPTAEKIEVFLSVRMHFLTITTAVDPQAPKLFQWDHPFAWYVWHGGSIPSQYGLTPGWAAAAGITRLPSRWGDESEERFQHQGDGIILLVEGARETRQAGAGIFPQCLRSDLREVRATIEAYSRDAKMQRLSDGSAIGIDLRQGGSGYPVTVRVTADGRAQTYMIDRWD